MQAVAQLSGSSSTASDLASITGVDWTVQPNTQRSGVHQGEAQAAEILARGLGGSRRSPPINPALLNEAELQVGGSGSNGTDAPGSCPGNGVCNGLGGKDCCQGCPAYNNRQLNAQSDVQGGPSNSNDTVMEPANGQQGAEGDVHGMECFNCGTRQLFLLDARNRSRS